MKNHIKSLAAIGLLSVASVQVAAAELRYSGGGSCPVDPSWITSPSMPVEVKKSGSDGSSNFCDFYQFSMQAYFYLMSPVEAGSDMRQFEVAANYPLMEFTADGKPANSCDESVTGETLRSALDKTSWTTHQAGGGEVIFDQSGNAAFYDMRFNRGMCDLTGSAVEMQRMGMINFPSGTTELKFGWKVLTDAEIASGAFLAREQSGGELKGKTLGLIGMHLAVATTDHPEFVWTSFEQLDNVPNCGDKSDRAWSFTSEKCAKTLPQDPPGPAECNFNVAHEKTDAITGTPTEICRLYPDGTADGDPNAKENRGDIDATNQQIAKLLAENPDPRWQVLKNYFLLGGLWVSDITKDSDIDNQRGSLRLANPIAETTFQDVVLDPKKFISNCFGCHNYLGTGDAVNNNITAGGLSHIYRDIIVGQGRSVDVQAGPIWSNADAPGKCPQACGKTLTWNGNWTTTVPGRMSVCGCELK